MIETKSMLLITSTWGNPPVPTFKMIPLSSECPYQEVIFDPGSKSLAIISKMPMKKFTMVPKLDGLGHPMMEYGKNKKDKPIGYKQERVQIDSYNEYYIENALEIDKFVDMFATNYQEWADEIGQYLVKTAVPPGDITLPETTVNQLKNVSTTIN